jgi:hypothetical protein
MNDSVRAVNRVRGSEDGEGQLLVAPGALNIDDRDNVTFYGNGTSSPVDVMARVIELDPQLRPFHANRDAAHYAAAFNINTRNPALSGRSPEAPLGNLEQFNAQGGAELKRLLAPLVNRLDEIREMVANLPTGMGGDRRQNVATGNVRSLGLSLPIGDK